MEKEMKKSQRRIIYINVTKLKKIITACVTKNKKS